MAMETDDRLINIDIMGALRRRKWYGIFVAAVGIAATVGVVMNLKASYQSTATILIEEPDVPADLVKSTVSTFANDRLQVIQQRVMTSQHLNEIIDRFGLYPEMQLTLPRSAIVNSMRKLVFGLGLWQVALTMLGAVIGNTLLAAGCGATGQVGGSIDVELVVEAMGAGAPTHKH